MTEQVIQREGVGLWMWLESKTKALFLPLLEEDEGKIEWVDGYHKQLSQSLLGLVSGGIKELDRQQENYLDAALARELRQERGWTEADWQWLPWVFPVHQIRKGQRVDFNVHMAEVQVPQNWLSNWQAINFPSELQQLFDEDVLRPFAWQAAILMREYIHNE